MKISKSQIRTAVGSGLLSSAIKLGTRVLPYPTKAISKFAPSLAHGALSGLASLGVDKIFGSGQGGGFFIPKDKLQELVLNRVLLNMPQLKQLYSAIKTGMPFVLNPTKSQSGGLLGSVLASIGIP